MADYQLTASPNMVHRMSDHAWIPNDPANNDWIAFQAWLAAGNIPDPYVAPPESLMPLEKRQFWMQAAIDGKISQDDAIDAMGGEIPQPIADYIATLPPAQRFEARMAFLGDTFERNKAGARRFKETFHLNDDEMVTFFTYAAAL